MVNPVGHVWHKNVEPLTLDALLALYREAVDLRPLDPRIGIWPNP